jgi:hypothetical protein
MLPAWCIVFAIALRLGGGLQYAWGVVKGRARPNPVTWFLWGFTSMVAFAAQLQEGVGLSAFGTFALGLSPLLVFTVSVIKNRRVSHLTPFTIACATCTFVGIILWQVTSNASLAILFSIIADIFAGLPTIVKAYSDPSSEYSRPYLISIISTVIILLTIHSFTFAALAFPLYMFLTNVMFFTLATIPLRQKVQGYWRRIDDSMAE